MIERMTGFLTTYDQWLRILSLLCLMMLAFGVVVSAIRSVRRLKPAERYALAGGSVLVVAAALIVYETPNLTLGVVVMCVGALLMLVSSSSWPRRGRYSLLVGLTLILCTTFPLSTSRPGDGDFMGIAAVIVACVGGVLVALAFGVSATATDRNSVT